MRMWRNWVDAPVSETGGFGHGGSTPSVRTPRRLRGDGCQRRRPPSRPGGAPQPRRPTGRRHHVPRGVQACPGPVGCVGACRPTPARLRSSVRQSTGFRPRAQRFDSSRGPAPRTTNDATPWPSGEARACNARNGGSTPPGVSHTRNGNDDRKENPGRRLLMCRLAGRAPGFSRPPGFPPTDAGAARRPPIPTPAPRRATAA